ncbi:hypothetical protein AVT43_gp60 [Polaribacter phage P12002L]|uniref:Uncharacterized protein n=2 Tax=Incheonvirus TaxID=2976977 RepID=A0A0F7IJR5_9CAUD|nr:hypothetical protein AVT42_gp62 [Polaribacter phage P12002S]YP_009209720.1 hypothetical protein AVT43_gp60 [Polaribacter phage P12002L]AKG94234.1 hypothetical protein P12002L_0060 [Polaribacter phage P12002L]AKG94318.1 hypothetical protein P12002S_0062 [Polaribacter phage P12002S]
MDEIIQLANKAMNMLEVTELNNKDKTLITDVIHKIRKQAFSLNGVGCSFLKELIIKEELLKTKLAENLDLYKEINNMVEYDKTFSQWNKCNLVLWDLKDALYRFGVEVD